MTLIYLLNFVLRKDMQVVNLLQLVIINSLLLPALCAAVMQIYTGQQPDFATAYRVILRRMPSVLGTNLLLGLLLGLPIVVQYGMRNFVSFGQNGGLTSIYLAFSSLLLPSLIYFYVRLLAVIPVIVMESKGGWQAITRSWKLTRGSFWVIVGTLLVLGFLTFLVERLPALLIDRFFGADSTAGDVWGVQSVAIVLSGLGQVLVLPMQGIIYSLIYYRLTGVQQKPQA